jgi:3'-phosphoadenosine 5'-phosphosulfate sulfotransferase (PAPS reductase)/FAD synthetase
MRVIFSSYGNDSLALIEWTRQRGHNNVIVAYSDTGWAADWWSARVEKAEEWARSIGYSTVRIASEGMAALVQRKSAWPRGGGGTFQFCTGALKEEPALRWLATVDPEAQAICMVGIRREESRNRATFPEWTESSPKHGGRSLHAPLVTLLAHERDELLKSTPFQPLPYRSKECYPCVNAGKRELRLLDPQRIALIRDMEREAGTNSKGNERVMFSPARHGGAVGIKAVVTEAQRDMQDMFPVHGCDGGWCE